MNVHSIFSRSLHTDMKHLKRKFKKLSTVSLNLIGPSGAEREKGVKRKCCGGGGRLRGAKKRDEIEDFSHLQILEQRHFHTPEIK